MNTREGSPVHTLHSVRPRRGRPPGSNSDETRDRLIEVARDHFATHGFAAASVSAIARAAGIVPSAVYHYFANKEVLYEEVFAATAPLVWTLMVERASQATSLAEGVDAMLEGRSPLSGTSASAFLAALPTIATLHPEFNHLLVQRTHHQDRAFGFLAELGLRTGELSGFTHDEAVEVLRALIMGWFTESHYSLDRRELGRQAVRKALARLASVESARRTPQR